MAKTKRKRDIVIFKRTRRTKKTSRAVKVEMDQTYSFVHRGATVTIKNEDFNPIYVGVE